MMFLTICDWDWQAVGSIFQGVATITAAVIVFFLAKRTLKQETKERLGRYRHDKLYEAGAAFWGLLAYTTDAENPHSILSWQKDKGTGQKTWYLHKKNAEEFIQKLNEINYSKGHGLFLRPKPRELFYQYRNILYGLLLAEKNNSADKIHLQKNEVADELIKMHKEMVLRLIKEMNVERPELPQN